MVYLNFLLYLFFQITRRDETIQQLEGDLDTSRKQLKDAIEEVKTIFSDAISVLSVGTWGPVLVGPKKFSRKAVAKSQTF